MLTVKRSGEPPAVSRPACHQEGIMKVLIVGAGVIGTVYGAHLAAAGAMVTVLSHGPRTDDVAATGLSARDVLSGAEAGARAVVVPDASGEFDVVLVAVRREQLASACAELGKLAGKPAIAAALYRCGTDPARLAADRATLTLMCRAITEAFAELRSRGVKGVPRNLAVLHSPLLRPVAVRYWTANMRSPMGELCFAAHCRHAETEMRALGRDVAQSAARSPALAELLRPYPDRAVLDRCRDPA
jgi:ketopantoate reductase